MNNSMTVTIDALCGSDDVLHAACLGIPAELSEIQYVVYRLKQRRATRLHCL